MTIEHIAGRATNYDKLHVLEEHAHGASLVYPTLAGGEIVTAGAAWTLGAFKEIIPVNTILYDFDLHWVNIEAASVDEIYELVFYAATTEIGRVRFTVTLTAGNRTLLPPVRIQTGVQPKNTQIQAKIATASGGDTCTISLFYHIY